MHSKEDLGGELSEAVNRGDEEKVIQLLSKGADINYHDQSYGWTPLHNCAREGNFQLLKLLISKGAHVNSTDKMGQTPLHRAAQRGHKKVVTYLLFSGADPLLYDSLEQSPSELALQEHFQEVFHIILKAMDKRRKELELNQKKEQKTLERQKKKEQKEKEKSEKKKVMVRQRSFSLDEGLEKVKEEERPRDDFDLSAHRHRHEGKEELKSWYHGFKRVSIVLDAFSKKDLEKMEAAGKNKIPKSSSVYEKADMWIKYINEDEPPSD